MVNIFDEDAFQKLVWVEGEYFRRTERDANEYSFHGVKSLLEETRASHYEAMRAEFASDEECRADWNENGHGLFPCVIYGEHGLHRYIVKPDGRIWFSSGHARAEMADKAYAVGFDVSGRPQK